MFSLSSRAEQKKIEEETKELERLEAEKKKKAEDEKEKKAKLAQVGVTPLCSSLIKITPSSTPRLLLGN